MKIIWKMQLLQGVQLVVFVCSLLLESARAGDTTYELYGASGSGPFSLLMDWIASFERLYPETSVTVSSVGSGSSQKALWGEIKCESKPVKALCDIAGNDNALVGNSSWGMGGGSISDSAYVENAELDLQQVPAVGGPILITYSKDVTGNMGEADTDAKLNMTMLTISHIFDGTITFWDDVRITEHNPSIVLPHEEITVIVRSDSSGMSQTLTQALSYANAEWPDEDVGKKPIWRLDFDSDKNHKLDGQTGVGIGLLRKPFSIGYLELGYYGTLEDFVGTVHIATISTEGEVSTFVKADKASMQVSMDGAFALLDDRLGANLVEIATPSGGYPIARFAYWYLKKSSVGNGDCYRTWLLREFIRWTYNSETSAEMSVYNGWVVPSGDMKQLALDQMDSLKCFDTAEGLGEVDIVDYTPLPYRFIVPVHDMNHPSETTKIAVYIFASISILSGVGLTIWTLLNWKTKIVNHSQPPFLLMLNLGCIVSSSSIFFFAFDDQAAADGTTPNQAELDFACQASTWTYSIGFILTFGALFAKTYRAYKIFSNEKLAHITIRFQDMLRPIVLLLLVDGVLLLWWSVSNPLVYTRVVQHCDTNGFPTTSNGGCRLLDTSASVYTFLVPIAVIHGVMLIFGNILAYLARSIPGSFQESKYIGVSMLSTLQIFIIGLPVLIIVADNAEASLFIRSAIIFLNDFGVICLIFVPKILALHGSITLDATLNPAFSMTKAVSKGSRVVKNSSSVSKTNTSTTSTSV